MGVVENMGIGQIGGEEKIFKRKFRWVMWLGESQMWYIKTSGRPNLNVDEVEINHLHEKHWIAGKPVWQSINMTIFDVKQKGDFGGLSESEKELQNWLNSVYTFSDRISGKKFLDMGDHDAEYKKNLTIYMLDGHGETMSTWWLKGAWPQTADWGELDYASSDTADVTATIRYDRAQFFPGSVGFATGGAD